MPIRTIIIQSQDGRITGRACVIAGQAYYESSGENSGTPGVWYPFEGIEDNTVIGGTERFWFKKPYFDRDTQANHHFPEEILQTMNTDEWERHKSVECLYVSCLRSGNRLSHELKNKLNEYINPNNDFFPLTHCEIRLDNAKDTFILNLSTIEQINNWLLSQGANLNNEPEQKDIDYPEHASPDLIARLTTIYNTLPEELMPLLEETLSMPVSTTSNNTIIRSWCAYFCCCSRRLSDLEEPSTNNTTTSTTSQTHH